MQLRPYQLQAVEAVYQHLRQRDDNPCVVLPTGSGKTPLIATICRDAVERWGGRVLVLAHVKELLAQAVDKLHVMAPDLWMQIGVYSAGLSSRDTAHPIIVAGIQSVYQKARELGRFEIVLIDESHMIPPSGEGMYRRFLEDARQINPQLRVIGLTATPFRMSSGPICVPPPEGILNSVCYEVGVRELIRDGYLSPLRSKGGKFKANTDDLHVRGGEFIPGEVEALMDQDMLVYSASKEIVEHVRSGGRKACLIFAAGVKHGRHVAKIVEQVSGEECGFVDGETPSIFRDQLIQRFREGQLRYLANVNVLTTGFDAPNVDCVALLRPTMSPGLYYQMVGRGFRLCPGKVDCLVLDFGGNVLRHGPVDQIRVSEPNQKRSGIAPAKECPQCQSLIATGYAACPECGFVFPPPERREHDGTADATGVLSGEVTITEYPIRSVNYSVHVKRDAAPDAPRSMRVDYEYAYYQHKSEWVCFEHHGFARLKAEAWWKLRSCAPVPTSAEEAVTLANAGALAETLSITVRSVAGEKFDRIVDCELGAKPEPAEITAATDEAEWDHGQPDPEPAIANDDIPF
ncbi:MAG: DEAD/DEAH box helicase family protein [Phycisphaerae bacterium]